MKHMSASELYHHFSKQFCIDIYAVNGIFKINESDAGKKILDSKNPRAKIC